MSQNPVLLRKHRGKGLEGPTMPPWGNDRGRAGDEGLDSGLCTYMPGGNVYKKEATYDF